MKFHQVILYGSRSYVDFRKVSSRFSRTILSQQGDYRAHYVNRFRDLLRAVQFIGFTSAGHRIWHFLSS